MVDHKVRTRSLALIFIVVVAPLLLLGPAAKAACYALPPGTIGWWKAEGSTNETLGLFPLTGTTAGPVAYVTGAVGQAFQFNGSNSWFQVPDINELSPHVGNAGEITLEAWIYMERAPKYDTATGQANRAIVVKGSPSNWEYGFYITTNLVPVFSLWTTSGSGVSGASPTNSLGLNQWYHLVGAMRKGQFTRLYINGQLAAESTVFSGDTGNGTSPLYIGRRGDGQWFDGRVDEVCVWGRALNGAEVAGIYAAAGDGKCQVITAGASVPYATDFENGIGREWTLGVVDNQESRMFSSFSGRFNNSQQTLTLTNLVPGQSYTVGFDFYALDSWDGNSQNDLFNIRVNGVPVFVYTFSNYNGEPPNSPQSFPGKPDQGRAHFGFNPSYVDAIYRSVPVSFTASNSVAMISFSGSLNEDASNESWGIDNVTVNTTASLTNTYIRSTTLPNQNSTNSVYLDSLAIAASAPLAPSTATNAANYSLKAAGVDGVLGSGDDINFAMVPSLPGAGGQAVLLALAAGVLPPGSYRFQTGVGLQDTDNSGLPVFTRDFVLRHPVQGVLETANNDSIPTATPLPVTESPVSSTFFTAFGVGDFSSTTDNDYWRFEAEAGDLVTVRVETESLNTYPYLYVQNASGANVATVGGSYEGVAQIQNLGISTPGTYYLRIWNANVRSRYWLRLDQSRGIQTENEGNDSQNAANQINLAFSSGLSQGRIAGSLPTADSAGDYYRLGTLNTGNLINVSALYPTGSIFSVTHPVLSVYLAGQTAAAQISAAGNLSYNVTADGVYFVRVESTNRNLRAQYLLNLVVSDGVLPAVTGTSLPAENGATDIIFDRFSLNFSEDMAALSVSNSANYELRGAGVDDTFGTADDTVYQLVTTGYSSGLTSSYSILDGPVQPGRHRLTVSSLEDRAGNGMAPAFVRNFRVENVSGFVLETRDNYSGGTSTRMVPTAGTNGTGALGWISSTSTQNNPRQIATGHFNSDTNLDIVVAHYGGDSLGFYTNNGLGQFASLVNVPAGDGALGVKVRDFNGDGLDDVAVANYEANTVGIWLRSASTFVLATNMTGFSSPYYLESADLNSDGKFDLVVPNYGNGTISVLLGNGDGTFQTRSNSSGVSGPVGVALADLNADGRPDFAVANYSSASIGLFTNRSDGTFVLATNIAVGSNPHNVKLADMNQDNKLDLVVAHYGDDTVGVLLGNGGINFQPRKSYYTACTDPTDIAVVDLNGDGAPDVVVPGYGNNDFGVLLNDGTGDLSQLYPYDRSGNPIAVTTGDFNNDGRPDVALSHHNGNYFEVWAGLAPSVPGEDPPGSGLRTATARGRRGNSSDVDYFRFDANAGDQVVIAVDNPGNPGSSSLRYRLVELDGTVYTTWYGDSSGGYGQSPIYTLFYTGSYLVEVTANHDYQGEYRLRVTLARPPLALETEDNNTISAADPLNLARSGNRLRASVAGAITTGDPSDFHQLGYLQPGDTIRLTNREPATSGLAQIFTIYRSTDRSAGTAMTNSQAGVSSFQYIVPPDQQGYYYVQVAAGQGSYLSESSTALNLYNEDHVNLGPWFNYNEFTISFWANPVADQPGYANIMDNNHQSGVSWVIQQNSEADNQYTWGPADGSPGILFNLSPNIWQHVTITRDATNISRVYINGSLVGTAAGTGQINYNGAQYLRIGRWKGTERDWDGGFDELRIWNRALSAPEIIAGMTGSLVGTEPGLLGYWPFNEAYGSTAADLSTNNRPATLVSAGWLSLGPTNAAPAGLFSQYILDVDLSDSVAPEITSISLPANGASFTDMIHAFTVAFNEEMETGFQKLSRNVRTNAGSSYVLTDNSGNWWAAQQAATNLGGNLVTINSTAENSFVYSAFSNSDSYWIGLSSLGYRENLRWASGEPVNYTAWGSSQPDNSGGNQQAVRLFNNGNSAWDDTSPWNNYRGIVEVTSTADTDNDGIVNVLDPYPTDPYNAFDLRATGPDNLFDTADDIRYGIQNTDYAGGLTASFAILDGPLQQGTYRFKVTTGLKDRFGNALPAQINRYFTNSVLPGFITESREVPGNTSSTTLSQAAGAIDGSFAGLEGAASAGNPYYIASADLNGDAFPDVVTANISADVVRIYAGAGNGTFNLVTNLPTGDGPIHVTPADFNGDSIPDLAIANYYAHTVAIWRGLGGAMFAPVTNMTGFSNPYNLLAADFNGDGKLDLAVPNYGGSTIIVRLGAGDGTFGNAVSYVVGGAPETIQKIDFNGDGVQDLVVANYSGQNLSLLAGNSDGTFQPAVNLAMNANTRYVTVGDVNADSRPDLVACGGNRLSVFLGSTNGTFLPRADYSIDSDDVYDIDLVDVTGDNRLDAVVSSYGNSRVIIVQNKGDGTFGPYTRYNPGGNPIGTVVGDFNSDGISDLATVCYSGNKIYVYLGNANKGLMPDSSIVGLSVGGGRGMIFNSGEIDNWSFSADAGDRILINTESPGYPGSASLRYDIYYPNWDYWTRVYSDGTWNIGSFSLVAPVDGTYWINVRHNNTFTGEYRLRVSIVKPPVQIETESNNSTTEANSITYALSGGQRNATILGQMAANETSDYFHLGNLAPNTQVTLTNTRPATSQLFPALEIYNATSALVAKSAPGAPTLIYTVGPTDAGAYFARVTWQPPAPQPGVTNAVWFDGSDDYVNLGGWAPGTNWTVQGWVMPSLLPSGRRQIAGAAAENRDWGIVLQDGRFALNTRGPAGLAVSYINSTAAERYTWYHVLATCDGTNAYLYVNGQLVASGPSEINATPTAAGTRIGANTCCGQYFPRYDPAGLGLVQSFYPGGSRRGRHQCAVRFRGGPGRLLAARDGRGLNCSRLEPERANRHPGEWALPARPRPCGFRPLRALSAISVGSEPRQYGTPADHFCEPARGGDPHIQLHRLVFSHLLRGYGSDDHNELGQL